MVIIAAVGMLLGSSPHTWRSRTHLYGLGDQIGIISTYVEIT